MGKTCLFSEESTESPFFRGEAVAFNVVYATSGFPPSLNDDANIKAHKSLTAAGDSRLANSNGAVCRIVGFSPGNKPVMHRTQSLDYGVLLDGTIEMMLVSGVVYAMRRGDVAVQRATMHAWRSLSRNEWARMLFVLQDCQPVRVDGAVLREDLRN